MRRRQVWLLTSLLGCAVIAPIAIAERAPARQTDVTLPRGEPIYQKWCSDCHSTPTGPGSIALQRKYQGNPPAILLQRTDMSPDLIKAAVRNGVSFMPSFRKTEISDTELAELAGYLAPARKPAQSVKKRR